VTPGNVLAGRARVLSAPRFLDLTGRARVKRMALGLSAVMAALVFANAVGNGFVLDDRGIILGNGLVTSPATAWRAFGLPYWPAELGGGQYRPLGIASFAIDWFVSGGDPRWFHAVNVLWHVAATVLVWLLAAELLAPMAAAFAAIVFAVHPVHVEAVANVVGRLEPMATVFVLLALLAHRKGNYLAPVWFALALLSKESAIVLVGLTCANDMLLERDWRSAFRARRWLYAVYGGVAIVYVAALVAVFHGQPLSNPARAFVGTGIGDRLAIVARVIPHYVRLLVAPVDLAASYAPNVVSPSPDLDLSGVVGVAAAAMFAVTLAVVAWRRRWPAMAFALATIPIALAPISNVLFASGVVLAERTLYLASVGACLAAGAAADRFLLQRPAWIAAAAASIVLAFGARTWTRTPVWRDDRSYVLSLLADHPESYEGHLVAGRVFKGANAFEDADRELTIARTIFPRDSLIYREAADLAARRGRMALAQALRDSARIATTLPLPNPLGASR
jgi:protein O-mannosyl-transferase